MASSLPLHTVLVHHNGSPRADDLLHTACDLVGPDARVVALAVTPVPPSLPLDGLPLHVDRRAREALRRAEAVAARYGYRIETQLRRGRDLAKVIVLEASWIDADAIFLTLDPPRFRWLPAMLSGTVHDVLHHAPCPVFVGHIPGAGTPEASAVIAEAERVLGGSR